MAGVSPAVVSYVINGGPRPVSKETRARVESCIAALNYRPNGVASALRRGSARSLGMLMPSPINPYFAELADAVECEVNEAGYSLSIGITHDEDPVREQLHVRSLIDRRVDGLILTSSAALGRLRDGGEQLPPVVVLDRVGGDEPMPSVHVDNMADSARAVAHLQEWGHRRIGCVSGPWPIPVSRQRVQGWKAQQDLIGAPSTSALVCHAAFSARGGATAARALLDPTLPSRSTDDLTALFVASDAQVHGVLHVCSELGLSVPGSISIVSFDGTQSTRFTQPPVTSMRQPIKELAATGVRMLLDSITVPGSQPASVTLRTNLVVGSSCAAPRSG